MNQLAPDELEQWTVDELLVWLWSMGIRPTLTVGPGQCSVEMWSFTNYIPNPGVHHAPTLHGALKAAAVAVMRELVPDAAGEWHE